MATIVTRAGKGSALTFTEGDANFTNLNNELVTKVASVSGTAGRIAVGGTSTAPTVDLATTAVSAGSYTYATITVDAYGRLTAASSGTTPLVSGGALGTPSSGTVTNLTGTASININGTVGATTPNTGAFTTVSTPTVSTTGATNLTINTNSGTNSGVIAINQGANANITLTPNGTGQTLIKNLEYNENVFSLGTTSGTIAPDVTNGNVQTITLNGNLTINAFTNPVSGQSLTLIIATNGTGRTLTSSMLFAGGSKTLSTTNTTDILTISYIGTTYYASLVKGYA